MSQDSLNKIKDTESKAKSIVDNARKDVAHKISSEKKKWDEELGNIKESSDAKLKIKIEGANKKAEQEKIKRQSEIEASTDDIKNNSNTKIDEAVEYVVKEFISRYK